MKREKMMQTGYSDYKDVVSQIDEIADSHGTTRNAEMRMAMRAYIVKYKHDANPSHSVDVSITRATQGEHLHDPHS